MRPPGGPPRRPPPPPFGRDRPAPAARAAPRPSAPPPAGAAPPRPPEPDRHCGTAAVSALFNRRPAEVLRLFFVPELRHAVGPWCGALAAARRPFREVGAEELARVAGTPHHGGVVAVAQRRRVPQLLLPLPGPVLAVLRGAPVLPVLDGVGNPHNLGAVARSAAYFGALGLVLSGDPRQAGLSDAAFRVSEGGLEALSVFRAPDLPTVLGALEGDGAGPLLTVAAVAAGGVAPESIPRGRPLALVLGNEEHGPSPATLAACAARVTLRGSGRVESLNVSVAAGVLLHELSRR